MSIEAAAAIAETLKDEKTFDARSAVTDATYPADHIDVYSNAAVAHELNLVANDAAKARYLAETIKANFIKRQRDEDAEGQSIEHEPYVGDGTEAPGYAEADTEATKAEALVPPLLAKLQETVRTFHVRGLAPAQWRLIDAKWRKAIKPPARKNYPQTPDGEEEYELAVYERNIERTAAINNDQIASAITSVVRKFDGATDTSVWKVEHVAQIHDTYLESEYDKLKNLVVQLTFANNLFHLAVERDADFL
jgi:hypothetical protein